MENFDIKHLQDSFNYDPITGILIRKSTNKPVKCLDAYGYIQVGYCKKMYKAHRLIWAIVYEEFPKGQIDHINGNRSDNKLANLRVVTQQQNAHNKQSKNRRNKSGYVGVSWNKSSSKWQAAIGSNKKTIYLGVFSTPEDAHLAYLNAKKLWHPTAPH
jgi:hypothetical protein